VLKTLIATGAEEERIVPRETLPKDPEPNCDKVEKEVSKSCERKLLSEELCHSSVGVELRYLCVRVWRTFVYR